MLYNKINDDGRITLEEYESYHKLMKEFDKEFNNHRDQSQGEIDNFIRSKTDEFKKALEQQLSTSNAVSVLRENKMKV